MYSVCSGERPVHVGLVQLVYRISMGPHKFITIRCFFRLSIFSSKLPFNHLHLSVPMMLSGFIVGKFAATLMQ